MQERYFASTGKLFKLYLKRDRIILPLWILLALMVISGQLSFVKSMPDWKEFITELSASPLTSSLLGPVVPLSIEGAILWRGMLQSSITVMFGAAFTVIRHTRSEESSGRNELIFGRQVGRYANLSASLILACGASLLAGIIIATFLIGNGFAVPGSLLAGLTVAASGCIFAGVGGLCAQIFLHSGRARGVVFGIYGLTMVAMVLNNMKDGRSGWVWLAPESWFRITIPFGENHIWPLLVFIALSNLPILLSYMILGHRDMGAGLIPQRDGLANASPRLNSPMAFAWRQHKGKILAWAIGMAYLGGMMGMATPNISESISPTLSHMNTWGAAIAKLGNQEAFVATLIYILGLMGGLSVFAISGVQTLKGQEKDHYTEIVLSRSVGRTHWMGSYLIVIFAGSALILLSLGLSTGLGWSLATGDFIHLPRVMAMSLSKIPSVWLLVGISAMLYGLFPKLSGLISWLILGIFIIVEMLWEAGIVEWTALKFTPFAYAHYTIPIHELNVLPLLILVILSVLLSCIGFIGFSTRSIE